MTTPAQQMPFTWEVIGIEGGQYEPGPNTTPVRGRRVTYKLGNGTVDSVFVPDSQWSADVVSTIVARAAKTTYDIGAMTSAGS